VTVEQIPGSQLIRTSGKLEFTLDGTQLTWAIGARHTLKGKLIISSYTFVSDPGDPLVFDISHDGYVYEKGRGMIITPTGERIYLQTGAIAGETKTSGGQRIAVCFAEIPMQRRQRPRLW
jgi:hypothetical protein